MYRLDTYIYICIALLDISGLACMRTYLPTYLLTLSTYSTLREITLLTCTYLPSQDFAHLGSLLVGDPRDGA